MRQNTTTPSPTVRAFDSPTIRVLEADPELATGIPLEEFGHARSRSVARVQTLRLGAWRPDTPRDPVTYGLLVLDGFAGGRMSVAGRKHLEILGPGDLLRPWVTLGTSASVASSTDWEVFETMHAAVLDRDFALRVAPWPGVSATLMHRLVLRARRLNFQLAVTAIPGIEERLLVLLWHLADRWGKITPDGVLLELGLTHANLAQVVGATRPTVSSGLKSLRQRGVVRWQRQEKTWLLCGEPPARLKPLQREVGLAR